MQSPRHNKLADVCCSKDAKVWIPDAAVVWKCALLLDDYKGPQQALRVCYEEDGTVSTLCLKKITPRQCTM